MQNTVGDYYKLLKSKVIPKHTYVSAETEPSAISINEHLDLHRRVVCEWLPKSGYVIADASEITVIYSFADDNHKNYIQVLIPIEKK